MSVGQIEFKERVRRLVAKHRAMAHGYTTFLRPDGLIQVKPRRQISLVSGRSVVICLAVLFVFKGLVFASLGHDSYHDRLTALENGSAVERIGAVVMHPDPLSDIVARLLAPKVH